MRLIYIFIICIMSSLLNSCENNCNRISTKVVTEIVKGLNQYPIDGRCLFNLVCVDGNFEYKYITNIDLLYQLYQIKYNQDYLQFPKFLKQAINHKMIVEYDNNSLHLYIRRFKVDRAIQDLYEKESLDGIIKRYCNYDKKGNVYKLINGYKNLLYRDSIAYYFSINGFYMIEKDTSYEVTFLKIETQW